MAMQSWQIMSCGYTFGIWDAVTAEGALQLAVDCGALLAGTWDSHVVRDGFRVILQGDGSKRGAR